MMIAIEPNPNSKLYGVFSFEELNSPKPVRAIQLQRGRVIELWDVTGVDEGGVWIPAMVQKVSDSGAAFGFLIFGGSWGIRLRLSSGGGSWDFANSNQKGEAYLIYADESGLVYA